MPVALRSRSARNLKTKTPAVILPNPPVTARVATNSILRAALSRVSGARSMTQSYPQQDAFPARLTRSSQPYAALQHVFVVELRN